MLAAAGVTSTAVDAQTWRVHPGGRAAASSRSSPTCRTPCRSRRPPWPPAAGCGSSASRRRRPSSRPASWSACSLRSAPSSARPAHRHSGGGRRGQRRRGRVDRRRPGGVRGADLTEPGRRARAGDRGARRASPTPPACCAASPTCAATRPTGSPPWSRSSAASAQTSTRPTTGSGHHPAPLPGGVFETYDDHRLATAAAVLGLAVPGVQVVDVATTGKTLPGFVDAVDRRCSAGAA